MAWHEPRAVSGPSASPATPSTSPSGMRVIFAMHLPFKFQYKGASFKVLYVQVLDQKVTLQQAQTHQMEPLQEYLLRFCSLWSRSGHILSHLSSASKAAAFWYMYTVIGWCMSGLVFFFFWRSIMFVSAEAI